MRALAGVVMALAACGDSLTPPVDASLPDARDGVVRVRVGGIDNVGLRVFFQNNDSSLVLATRTAADGTANAYMAPGGFVTVQDGLDLFTWSGVEPGDELVLPGNPPPDPPKAGLVLSLDDDPDATSLWLHTPCTVFLEVTSARLSPLPVELPGCASDSDVLVVSRKADFSTIAHFTSALDVKLGTTFAPTVLSISAPWRVPQTSTIRITNAPGGLAFLYAHQEVLGAHGVVFDSKNFSTATIDVVVNAPAHITMPVPDDARLVTYVDDPGSASGRNLIHAVSWGAPTVETDVDLASTAFPKIVQVPFVEPSDTTIRWSAQAQPVVPEASLVDVRLNSGGRWRVIAPSGAETVVSLPRVPFALFDSEVAQSEVTSLISIASSDGYAAYRGTLLGWSPTRSWPITTPTGRVSYVQYLPN